MDYHSHSMSGSMRGHSSYRGSSYRGSRGGDSFRGSRGGYSPRGRGGYSYPKYEHSGPKHSTSENKYNSTFSRYDDCYRRSDSAFGSRDHRTDLSEIASRKRERSDSYSQGAVSRRDDDDYRSSRYGSSSAYPESRSYEERSFKKPRTSEFKSEYRVKEPMHTRTPRGRSGPRGSFARRSRGDSFSARRRGSFASRNMNTTATPSEILAIRRAKLLQKRMKDGKTAPAADEKNEKSAVEDEVKDDAVKADKPTDDEAADTDEGKAVTDKIERTTAYGRPFIKLQCPHCEIKCITFKEYIAHLNREVHVRAMKVKSDNLKTALAAMRIAQRDKQKIVDEEDLTSMTTRTHFCVICKLSYSQERTTHQASELHKKLRDFLMPHCKTCRIAFQTPMQYEHHVCSLDHLRRAHDMEEREKRSSGVLDNFMVLDSVGSGSGDELDEKADDEQAKDDEKDLLLGLEFIRDVTGKYCEVCRTFLTRAKNYDRVLQRHCRTKEHLRCYLHYGNEALLEKMNAADDGEVKKVEEPVSKEEVKDPESEEQLEAEKLWDGLSELLDEAQPRSKSEDEDDEEGGRFDRFRSKEKKENGDISTEIVRETESGEESLPTEAVEKV